MKEALQRARKAAIIGFNDGLPENFHFKGKSEMVRGFFGLISNLFPNLRQNDFIKEAFAYKTDELPFSDVTFNFEGLIGRGGHSDVFLLRSRNGNNRSVVLKFSSLQQTGSVDFDDLNNGIRSDCNYAIGIFGKIPVFILPQCHIVCKDPFFGNGCIVTIQPYIEQMQDIFGMSAQELKDVWHNEPQVRDGLSRFVRAVDNDWEREDIFPDIVGANNLVIIRNEIDGNRRVVLIDTFPYRPSKEYKRRYDHNLDTLRQLECM